MKSIVLKPKVSEKGYALSEERRTYIFEVPRSANKHAVAKSVASQYEVTVENVRIAGTSGKPMRTYRRGGRTIHKSHRSNIRKAYVTLKEGDKLPIFAAVEESAKPEAKKESK